ncbi:MAG: hypothetical protein A2W93_05355 [Bacteroidetes bacterium GWF2_43_63]|nr:MAG: hypothetical protein A2W94_11795 [Bacteroidetes bacterium GWE2_42_42]OFY56301.1 MAG: hypothetical protein A2W93_05355 [Bacteroidetes bacterium GWF2_43_63]
MNLIDIVLLIPLGWGIYKGFSKGLIHELAQIAALVLGVLAGLYLSKWIGGFIADIFGTNEQHTQLIAFMVAFLGALILVFLVARMAENAVKNLSLGIVNRIIGAAFASIKFILILSLLINFINSADPHGIFLKKETREGSLLYKPVGAVAPLVMPFIMQVMSDTEKGTPVSSPEE